MSLRLMSLKIGNYIRVVHSLKEKVNSIGYDEERKLLYGLNRSKDIIYTYNIASIVDEL